MDAYQYDQGKAPSHFECVAGYDTRNSEWVKQKAFNAMSQLEGWCPQQKAAVLIDLVLIKSPELIVEIGVFGGKSLIPMAYALKEIGKGKIIGIDPWSHAASAEGMEGVNYDYWMSVNHELILSGLLQKIYQFGLVNYIDLVRSTSLNAPIIQNIDFLHIDGNHSDETSYADVTKWVPLVRRGGIVIFDDINWATTKRAVDWLNQNCIKISEFQDTSIWGIWVKP